MPKLDKTGPMGQGAGTGRGMGSCNTGPKMGRGYGGGDGFGRRRFIAPKNEPSLLAKQK